MVCSLYRERLTRCVEKGLCRGSKYVRVCSYVCGVCACVRVYVYAKAAVRGGTESCMRGFVVETVQVSLGIGIVSIMCVTCGRRTHVERYSYACMQYACMHVSMYV